MTCRSRSMLVMLAAALACGTGPALSQTYPAKPVRMVTVAAGSGTDFLARTLAQSLSDTLGERIVVDNRGIIAIDIVKKAEADGYTLLLYTSPLWLGPVFRSDVTWNAQRDFVPITSPTAAPNVLVVHPSVPARTVGEFIAYAKARNGQLNYASGSTAASAHIAAELFKSMAGVKIVRVNFKGTGPALSSLFSGEVQLMFPAAGSALPHIRAGRVRGLAVTTAKPTALAPGLPTLAEAGLPGYESVSLTGVFAPTGTPASIVERLYTEHARVLRQPAMKDLLFKRGLEITAYDPARFTAFIKSEITRMEQLVKSAGLRE